MCQFGSGVGVSKKASHGFKVLPRFTSIFLLITMPGARQLGLKVSSSDIFVFEKQIIHNYLFS